MPSPNIFAWTAPPGAAYPEYISINDRDGNVEITVRSPSVGARCGDVGCIVLPPEEVDRLTLRLMDLVRHRHVV